jgi:ketosteroid isomerase-like protein
MKRKIFIALSLTILLNIVVVYGQTKEPKKINPKKVAKTMEVGLRGYQNFINAIQKGNWQPFFDMMTDDFTIFFPRGDFQGETKGKENAIKFFKYVGETFKNGFNVVEKLRITANETTIIFELRDEATLNGKPYKNRVALSWDIRGDKISAYREYFGSDGKSN